MTEANKEVSPVAKNRPPAAGMGRRTGSVNKTTKLAKDAIALAADGLGGTDRLIEWAKEDPLNERAFWTSIYTKLLPLQVQAAVSGGLNNSLEVVFKSAN